VNSIAGTWDLKMKTPIGSLAALYTFTGTDVTITGGTLTGHSRAGKLPRSGVTGTRRA
jgi:hypothetical protein